MKNAQEIKKALHKAVEGALKEHHNKYATLRNLDWFNASNSTTDFYIRTQSTLVA